MIRPDGKPISSFLHTENLRAIFRDMLSRRSFCNPPLVQILPLGMFLMVCFASHALDTTKYLNKAIVDTTPGAVLKVDFRLSDFLSQPYLNEGFAALKPTTGTLIYSDDPETPKEFGILYRDIVPAGVSRVYLYHVNGTSETAKLTVVVESASSAPATLKFRHRALPRPSADYLLVGKSAVRDYYENINMPADNAMLPGKPELLDEELDDLSIEPGELVNYICDFSASEPTTVTALLLPAKTKTLSSYRIQKFATNDKFAREGTFRMFAKQNEFPIAYDTQMGIQRLRIAEGKNGKADPPLEGLDVERGTTTVLKGNFGVRYHAFINVVSTDQRFVALLLNPRSGSYHGYAQIRYPSQNPSQRNPSNNPQQYYPAYRYSQPGGPNPRPQLGEHTLNKGINIPETAQSVNGTTMAVLLAKLDPLPASAGGGNMSPQPATVQTLEIDLIPAGASSLPIEIDIVPFEDNERGRINTPPAAI